VSEHVEPRVISRANPDDIDREWQAAINDLNLQVNARNVHRTKHACDAGVATYFVTVNAGSTRRQGAHVALGPDQATIGALAEFLTADTPTCLTGEAWTAVRELALAEAAKNNGVTIRIRHLGDDPPPLQGSSGRPCAVAKALNARVKCAVDRLNAMSAAWLELRDAS
jgi:hypothetical protein